MQSERYFIIADFYGLTDDRGQPLEDQVLALIDDVTAKEAELIAKAVETVCEESDQVTVGTLSESKSREDMVRHLVRCTAAAGIRTALPNRPAHDKDRLYRLARYAVRLSDEVRKLRVPTAEEQMLRRFEVVDEDTAQSIPFDATDTQHWGPVEYGTRWDGDFYTCHVQEALYYHASGHWTLISEETYFEAPCSAGKRAKRVIETEAIAWLVRYGFSLPDELEKRATPTFFVPGPPLPAPPSSDINSQTGKPKWDGDRRELLMDAVVCKRFRQPAPIKRASWLPLRIVDGRLALTIPFPRPTVSIDAIG